MTFLTIKEVSTKLRIHRVTVGHLVKRGELRAIKGEGKNGRVKIYADSVDEYLRRQAVPVQNVDEPQAS